MSSFMPAPGGAYMQAQLTKAYKGGPVRLIDGFVYVKGTPTAKVAPAASVSGLLQAFLVADLTPEQRGELADALEHTAQRLRGAAPTLPGGEHA